MYILCISIYIIYIIIQKCHTLKIVVVIMTIRVNIFSTSVMPGTSLKCF